MDQPQHDMRYAPPQTTVDDVVSATEGRQLASRGRRFAAAFLDGTIQIAILWLVSKLTPYDPWGAGDRGMWSIELKSLVTSLGFFLVLNGYLLFTRARPSAR